MATLPVASVVVIFSIGRGGPRLLALVLLLLSSTLYCFLDDPSSGSVPALTLLTFFEASIKVVGFTIFEVVAVY